jgi:hypothetical protein
MNTTKLTSHCRWVSGQLRAEAGRWPRGEVRNALIHGGVQLAYQARMTTFDPEVAEAVVDSGIALLARAEATRWFRDLEAHRG